MKATLISEQTKNAIRTYLNLNAKFKNAYFWSSPFSANQRRSYEEKNSFTYEGDGITLNFEVSCSCKNIYINKKITINGETKNATSLKKYIK